MELEKHVVSLSLAKTLKELGVKQESYWVWGKSKQTAFPDPWVFPRFEFDEGQTFAPAFQYEYGVAAFTVAELFELMPMTYASVEQNSNDYRAGWRKRGQGEEFGRADNPTEALGLMLKHLIENNLLKN